MPIDPDYPSKLVELLPETLRQDYYHNRYEWRDTHFAFFNLLRLFGPRVLTTVRVVDCGLRALKPRL